MEKDLSGKGLSNENISEQITASIRALTQLRDEILPVATEEQKKRILGLQAELSSSMSSLFSNAASNTTLTETINFSTDNIDIKEKVNICNSAKDLFDFDTTGDIVLELQNSIPFNFISYNGSFEPRMRISEYDPHIQQASSDLSTLFRLNQHEQIIRNNQISQVSMKEKIYVDGDIDVLSQGILNPCIVDGGRVSIQSSDGNRIIKFGKAKMMEFWVKETIIGVINWQVRVLSKEDMLILKDDGILRLHKISKEKIEKDKPVEIAEGGITGFTYIKPYLYTLSSKGRISKYHYDKDAHTFDLKSKSSRLHSYLSAHAEYTGIYACYILLVVISTNPNEMMLVDPSTLNVISTLSLPFACIHVIPFLNDDLLCRQMLILSQELDTSVVIVYQMKLYQTLITHSSFPKQDKNSPGSVTVKLSDIMEIYCPSDQEHKYNDGPNRRNPWNQNYLIC